MIDISYDMNYELNCLINCVTHHDACSPVNKNKNKYEKNE